MKHSFRFERQADPYSPNRAKGKAGRRSISFIMA
jgi:hypothetical protein